MEWFDQKKYIYMALEMRIRNYKRNFEMFYFKRLYISQKKKRFIHVQCSFSYKVHACSFLRPNYFVSVKNLIQTLYTKKINFRFLTRVYIYAI